MSVEFPDYRHGANFSVGKDGQTVCVKEGKMDALYTSLIQWVKEPLSKKNRFYEVVLLEDLDSNAGQYCMLGTNVSASGVNPVWDMHRSMRYRSLDGGVFTSGRGLHSDRPFGKKGDAILVYLEESFEEKSLIKFFLNGILVYRQWVKVAPKNLYPALGVDRGPAKFFVIWPGVQKQPRTDMEQVKSSLSSWIGFRNFTKDDSTNVLTLSGLDEGSRNGFSVQAPRTLCSDEYTYFEMELISNVDKTSGPSIGLSPGFTSKFQSPGRKTMTIGYHAYSGKIYNESKNCTKIGDEDKRCCTVGDRVGCGVLFGPQKEYLRESMLLVYFTRNGQVVYTKPRFMPPEGFYPTVGMSAVGEHVKVLTQCKPPDIPRTITDEVFNKWSPLYTNFRFSEVVKFLDYDQSGTANKIQVDGSDNPPCIVQYTKDYGEICMFRVTIDNIDEDSELQLGAASRNIETQAEVLHNRTTRTALCLSCGQPNTRKISKGDMVDVVMQTTERGNTLLLFLVENRLVRRSHIENKKTSYEKQLHPTICGKGGAITLNVMWPDNEKLEETVPELQTKLSYWLYPDCVIISDNTMTCRSIQDDGLAYNVIAPYPLSMKGAFFFQMTYVLEDTPTTPVFPGIGITRGNVLPQQRLHLMLSDMWTVLYYASSQRLVTWKGTKEAECEEDSGRPSYSTVGCSATYNKDKNVFQLRFYCDLMLEVTAEVEAQGPVEGYFPVFSFHKGTHGQTFSTELTKSGENQCNIQLASLNPSHENLYSWRDEDLLYKVAFEDTTSVTSDVTRERQSLVNNLYISHCYADNKAAQIIMNGLQQKGYAVQMSGWNTGAGKMLNLEMAQVVILCLSPYAILDASQKMEFDHAVCKNLPLLPVILQPLAWPPSGLYMMDASSLERFSDVKLDLSQSTIDPQNLVQIEHNLQTAIFLSKEPVVLGPVPGSQEPDSDSSAEGDTMIPQQAIYMPNNNAKKSRSCTVL